MLKKLFCRWSETGPSPNIAEVASKLPKILDENRFIQGSTKRTADESGRGFRAHIDGLIHRCDFCDRDAVVNCI